MQQKRCHTVLHKFITLDLERLIENRKPVMLNTVEGANIINLFKDEQVMHSSLALVPILSQGDTYGAIGIISNSVISTNEIKILQTFANFISLQIG